MANYPRREHRTQNLDEHMLLIKEQVHKSMRDPELRPLAVKIVSGRVDAYRHDSRTGRDKPIIRAWGRDFIAPTRTQCEPRDDDCEVRMVWEFMVDNVRYVYDPVNADYFAVTGATLKMGGGDCDDFVIGFASLLQELGFRCAGRVVATGGSPDWSHTYPLVGVCSKDAPSRWVPLDATVKGATPGWQYDDVTKYADYEMWT